MAALTVSAWAASPLINSLVDKVRSYIEGQFNWHKDIKRNLQKLEIILKGIQTIVEKAEQLPSLDDSQTELLCSIKNAIYEADDVVDEFEYRILEAQAMKATGTVSGTAFSSRKFVKRLIGQDKLPKKLKNILDKLDNIRKSANIFNVQVAASTMISANEPGGNTHDYDTSSDLTSQLSGRVTEKNMLIDLLLQKVDEPESSQTNIPIITIIGVGGIGKTTLAQYVYNDQRVKDQFGLRMWICVSNNFDETTLTKKILESASGSNEKHKDVLNLDILKKTLQTELQSKTFLLILDDVWIDEKKTEFENLKMWEKILFSLKVGGQGSKILATTRTDKVARMIGTTNLISLTGLSNDENWSILKMYAFGNEVPHNYQELEKIGKEIVKKLKGSPLASSVVGAMLKDSLVPNEWLQILQIEVLNDVMSVLGLSYQCLPNHLKPCFRYCSIFPKDWHFSHLELVPLWIAQGYVHRPKGDSRTLMEIGVDYFKQLSSRSFFHKVSDDDTYYNMHDVIHDLAEFVSADECFRFDDSEQKEIPKTIRHLGVDTYDEDKIKDFVVEEMNDLENLRTLKFFGNPWLYSKDVLDGFSMSEKFMKLRVLDLRVLHFSKFPQAVNHLQHLRYLHLGHNDFEILPESVCGLYQLEVLVAVNLLRLSESLCRLLKFGRLMHLDVPVLVFEVGKKGPGIGILQCIGKQVVLKGRLHITNLKTVGCKREAVEVDLESKQYLTGLELDWDSSQKQYPTDLALDCGSRQRTIIGHDGDDEVADALRPHPNLKWLTVNQFRGTRPPSWLQTKWLVNLESLDLMGCFNLRVLPSLKHLPLLRSLFVSECLNLKQFSIFPRTIRDIFVGATGLISLKSSYGDDFWLTISDFPALLRDLRQDQRLRAIKEIRITDCHGAAGILKRASLKIVTMTCCPELPSEEVVVQSLIIDDCPGTYSWLFRCLQGLTFLKHLEITLLNWPKLESPSEADGSGVLPSSLESLEILYCCHTKRWLSRCLQGPTSLKHLKLSFCNDDDDEEDGLGVLPSSLESLMIKSCRHTKRWLSRCLQGLTSLKHLTVFYCNDDDDDEEEGGVLPSSLESLAIDEWHVTDLSLISHCLSLKHLKVKDCPELKSLPEEGLPASLEKVWFRRCGVPKESLERWLQGLASLSELTVDFWPHLTSLPSLRHLTVKYCSSEGTSEVELPQCLESLEISECDVSDMLLSTCLQGLTWLPRLKIHRCTGLTSLPSAQVLQRLTALQELSINGSKKLTSLGGLHAHASLKRLEVSGCPRLKSLPEEGLPASLEKVCFLKCGVRKESLGRCLQGLASLSDLTVELWPHLTSLPSLRRLTVKDCWSEGTSEVELPQCLESLEIHWCRVSDTLLSTCLQGLPSLSRLEIWHCTGLTSLPSAQVLQCLIELRELSINDSYALTSLGGLHAHASLKRLKVSNCPQLKSLPEEGLPSSIEYLYLRRCLWALKQQIDEKKGPDWEKVAHISDIDVD